MVMNTWQKKINIEPGFFAPILSLNHNMCITVTGVSIIINKSCVIGNKRKGKRKDILACIPLFGPQKGYKQSSNRRGIKNVSKRSEKCAKHQLKSTGNWYLRRILMVGKKWSLLACFAPVSKQKRSNDNDSSQR